MNSCYLSNAKFNLLKSFITINDILHIYSVFTDLFISNFTIKGFNSMEKLYYLFI